MISASTMSRANVLPPSEPLNSRDAICGDFGYGMSITSDGRQVPPRDLMRQNRRVAAPWDSKPGTDLAVANGVAPVRGCGGFQN